MARSGALDRPIWQSVCMSLPNRLFLNSADRSTPRCGEWEGAARSFSAAAYARFEFI
jgi:hypothetical protein